jgi:hypothetical protein
MNINMDSKTPIAKRPAAWQCQRVSVRGGGSNRWGWV